MHPRIEEMAALKAKKLTASQIAEAMKMRTCDVVRAMEDAGLRRKRADVQSRKDEILALHDGGMRAVQIARQLGLQGPSVWNVLAGAGRTNTRDDERTRGEILDALARADQRWAEAARGARYEDAHEAAWSPHRWRSRASGPGITCAAALMVDAR